MQLTMPTNNILYGTDLPLSNWLSFKEDNLLPFLKLVKNSGLSTFTLPLWEKNSTANHM